MVYSDFNAKYDCSLPVATLERELCLSRSEVETLIEAINSTMEESKKIERDLISIQVYPTQLLYLNTSSSP